MTIGKAKATGGKPNDLNRENLEVFKKVASLSSEIVNLLEDITNNYDSDKDLIYLSHQSFQVGLMTLNQSILKTVKLNNDK